MSATLSSFADTLGPRGRRRVAVGTTAAAVVVLAVLYGGFQRLARKGQLDADLWEPLATWAAVKFLLGGLKNTVEAASVSMVLAMAVGSVLALGRLSRRAPVRLVATAWIEFFRGIPLLLLILFAFFGLDLGAFRALVLGLTLYNSAVIAEIMRAGILSLDRGQGEAALAVGLRHGQAMRIVILPQALRRMIPALVSQLVTLLKDTSLGIIITYEELLRRSQIVGQLQANSLQAFVLGAVLYVAINFALSSVARWLERRQQRAPKLAAAGPIDMQGVVPVAAD